MKSLLTNILPAVLSLCTAASAASPPGYVLGWGDNVAGQATGVPSGQAYYSTGMVTIAGQALSNVVGVAASSASGFGLKADGTVIGWGNSWGGESVGYQTPYPHRANGQVLVGGQPLTNVLSISGARSAEVGFGVALLQGGTVVTWGYDKFGRTDVPAALSGVAAISAGAYHVLALRSNGTVVVWGRSNPPPRDLTNVMAIAAGTESGRNLAMLKDGTVRDWPVLSAEFSTAVPRGLTNVVAVAAGGGYSLALKRDGTVEGWGQNDLGQVTGTPTTVFPHQTTGTVVLAGTVLSNVVAIAAAGEYSLALKDNGTVVSWGHPRGMQMAVPAGLTNVVAIAAGQDFCLALTTNRWIPK